MVDTGAEHPVTGQHQQPIIVEPSNGRLKWFAGAFLLAIIGAAVAWGTAKQTTAEHERRIVTVETRQDTARLDIRGLDVRVDAIKEIVDQGRKEQRVDMQQLQKMQRKDMESIRALIRRYQ